MDPSVSSSFIPKKPLTGERGHAGAYGFILLISILVFIASGVAAGGAFVYGRILEGSLESKKKSLEAAKGAYDPGVIEDLIRLDARINQGRALLGTHVAPSSIFALLSEQTLEDVRFGSFEYTIKEDASAFVSLKGEAKDFSTVALQSDQFGGSKMLRDVIFSDITIGPEGGVGFSVSATIEPANLLYSKYLGSSTVLPLPTESESESLLSTTSPEL